MATYFTLVRHGETDWNTQHRWQGMADTPLNAAGEAQARALASTLVGRGITRVVASHLQRAHRTGELVNEVLGVPLMTDPRLAEIHVGDIEGLTGDEIAQHYPALHHEIHQSHFVNVQFPRGESRFEVGERAIAALRDLATQYPQEHVLVITHGAALRMILYMLLNLHETVMYFPNCSITRLLHENDVWSELGIGLPSEEVRW